MNACFCEPGADGLVDGRGIAAHQPLAPLQQGDVAAGDRPPQQLAQNLDTDEPTPGNDDMVLTPVVLQGGEPLGDLGCVVDAAEGEAVVGKLCMLCLGLCYYSNHRPRSLGEA